MSVKFLETFSYKLIYVFTILNSSHKGLLKIGETTISDVRDFDKLCDNSESLNNAAKSRIDQYTKTAGLKYELFYTTLAIKKNGNIFSDKDVHKVLIRSNVNQPKHELNGATEWFECDLETAKSAITAVKNGKISLIPGQITKNRTPIIFRPEQKDAINKTLKQFRGKNIGKQAHMLWNAKMRFGKTLSALEVVKKMEFKKTLIITHRPVVKHGWYEDFEKIFYDNKEYTNPASSISDEEFKILNDQVNASNDKFIYFASIQDLRGSAAVGGKYNKNNLLLSNDWDFIIVDEAHEGTQTNLGNDVIQSVINSKENTKVLYLSGTPFNLLSIDSKIKFKEEEVYTWDYVMEQYAKLNWVEKHFGDSNPYVGLPKLNIFTYNLTDIVSKNNYIDIEDKAFNFKEFFRIWTGNSENDHVPLGQDIEVGKFVHEKDIKKLLDIMVLDENSNYPFSTKEYQDNFRHSLWMLPGVKEARALSILLKEHPVFQSFDIINVAGDGDEEVKNEDALKMVQKAIGDFPEQTRTITLSCGRLTTGVSIPAWTAVFMLSGSSSTSASSYLQTIFRVQTPAKIGGKIKTNCYVFDFAPDRTLKMIAEAGNISTKKGALNEDRIKMGEFLNFCPVINFDGSKMVEYSTENMLVHLKKALIDRVARNGFDDSNLYNDKLLQLTDLEVAKFNELKSILGSSRLSKKDQDLIINAQGQDEEQRSKIKSDNKKELTLEEKERLELQKKIRKERNNAISILRGIAIRIPLMVYGAELDIEDRIDVKNFPNIVDDVSWEEFMPKGVTKEKFIEFGKYFDNEVFVEAGLQIRRKAKAADLLQPLERVQAISEIFATFRNPDKETVLTPWKTVNMHMGETIGGTIFFDNNYEKPIYINENTTAKWMDNNKLANKTFEISSKILEINSKSGLYSLQNAISIYQKVKHKGHRTNVDNLWKEIIKDNIYVLCRTKMSASITRRTLIGYNLDKEFPTNILVIEDIVEQMSNQFKDNYNSLVEFILNEKTWRKGNKKVKFNAIVGNPPYQKGNEQIYTDFYLLSRELGDIVSLIFPVGWQEPKIANNLLKLNNLTIKADKQIKFIDNRQNVFPGISGAEWTNFILWIKGYNNNLNGKQLVYTNGENKKEIKLLIDRSEIEKPEEIVELFNIISKRKDFNSIIGITSARMPYGLQANVIEKYDSYNLPEFRESIKNLDDIKVIGLYKRKRVEYFIDKDFPIPRVTDKINSYKVFIPKAWGNMDENTGLGGAYSDIILSSPNEICTESYIEQGNFDNKESLVKHSKYIMTRFVRGLFYLNKFSQNTPRNTWLAVPAQTYEEPWWDESILEIEQRLFDKYNIPDNIRKFILENIQQKDETNIINFK